MQVRRSPDRRTSPASHMKKLPRVLLVFSSLLLIAMFFLPLWHIRLEAPQYPEGISFYIMLRSIVGGGEFDLANVNMLNHYIGMKPIVAASIPELKWMPWIVGVLIITGLLAAWSGKYKALVAWVGVFTVTAIAGLADFYRWGYDYGHNLAPDAIIKIPGMTYQPPLIGTKQLLNFTAHSWPATGGIAAGIALAVGVLAVILATRGRRSLGAMALFGLLASGCAQTSAMPELAFDGREACAYCAMSITDPRTGGVVVTSKGKKYAFDSVDCLASFAATIDLASARVWVLDFEHPGKLLPVADALFVPAPAGLSIGMGGGRIAISSKNAGARPDAQRWDQLLAAAVAARSAVTGS